MKSSVESILLLSLLFPCIILLASFRVAIAQNLPPPDIVSGMYVYQGHIYYWNNNTKTSCHVANPDQHRLFMNMGIPNQSGSFSPYSYQGDCAWPQPAQTQNILSGMYVYQGHIHYWNNDAKTTCHVANPDQHRLFMNMGVPNQRGSFYPYNYQGDCPWPR